MTKLLPKIFIQTIDREYCALSNTILKQKLLSNRKKVQQFTENYDTLLIGIEMSRKTLYSRINKRVDIMLDHGLFRSATTC